MRQPLVSLVIAVSVAAAAVPAASAPAQELPAQVAQTPGAPPEQAGDALVAVGSVTDTAANGSGRLLHDGDPVYAGDTLVTGEGSYADVDFEDGGRMLLRPDTSFQIARYHFDPAAHGLGNPQSPAASAPQAPSVQPRENAFFRLIKGGFRALSGLIGHVDHADYAVETPVATIGIRGTGYEVRYCASNCGDSSGGSQQGLYTAVGKGAIALSNDSGETVTRAGQYGYIAGRQMHFRPLARAPRALARMQLPQRYWRRDAAMRQHVNSVRARRWPHYQRTLEQRLGRPPARGLSEFMHPHAAGAAAPRPEDRRAQPAAGQRQAFHATAAKIRPPRQPHRKKAAKKPPEQRRRHGGAT